MSGQPVRNFTRLAVVVVIAAVVIVAAVFAASANRTTQTTLSPNPGGSSGGTSSVAVTTSPTTSSITLPTTNSTASSSTQTSCVQSGIHGSLFVRVVSDNGPIEGANATATILNYCDSGQNQPNALGLTNSTGYAPNFVGWTGFFTVSVTYAGAQYTFPAQTNGGVSLATLSLPSGVVVEKAIGCGGLDCFNDTTTLTASSSQTTSSSTSSCSGSPPTGDCISAYSYTFTLSVNYTGPWKLAYEGCSGMGTCSLTPVMGSLNGTGFFSTPVTVSGLDNNGLTLCAQAQKLDGSGATLILTVTGYNETSLPYGSTSYCGGVAP
jgi:hypothetical protein